MGTVCNVIREILIFVHIVLFVYWLGADLGVYYSSRFVVKQELSLDARGTAAKIMEFVDMSPRICLVLILPSGVSLMVVDNKGASFLTPLLAAVTWIAAFIWLYLVIRNYHSRGDARAALIKRIDLTIRYCLVVVLSSMSLYVLFAHNPFGVTTNPKWLAMKVLLYSLAIFGGIQIRRILVPFGPAMEKIMAGKSDAAAEGAIVLSLKKSLPWVHTIWFAVLLAAFLGVTKIGAHV